MGRVLDSNAERAAWVRTEIYWIPRWGESSIRTRSVGEVITENISTVRKKFLSEEIFPSLLVSSG